MPALTEADTIRILVATDNHVGYAELDPIRKEDGWRSFDEILTIARERDVDMVLLAGDLFHENKPSRQAMYQVMRSLRLNCLGEKPCELEMLSDRSEAFEGPFNYVNYEDPDINIAIPVFSIHGNHDDPTGDGHLAALDILQMGGLVNYYGRMHESDNIQIKPVLLQKGRTKLALYGMSNVRDERLFRTFRDGQVKFFRPGTQGSDWFNLMSVHQNRHSYTDTGYLPEEFIPDFVDLVVWGHEHECKIHPQHNPQTGFDVMQPGSSIATSLDKSEAEPKHVAIVSVTGREYRSEAIRLKSVRPFKTRAIVLAEDPVAKKLIRKDDHRTELTRRLVEFVDKLIDEANAEWRVEQDRGSEEKPPKPLVRLRVECTPPEGERGIFDCENPQRFSNRFQGRVANTNNVVLFHRSKRASRRAAATADIPDELSLEHGATLESVKVDKLVKDYLDEQSLKILPQNRFGDAVTLFVDKGDKTAVEDFVKNSLNASVKHLLNLGSDDEEEEEENRKLDEQIAEHKARQEERFAKGELKNKRRMRLKDKSDDWDSDERGEHWADYVKEKDSSGFEDDDAAASPEPKTTRGRAKGTATTKPVRTTKTATSRKTAAAPKKAAPAAKPIRGRKQRAQESEEEEEDEEEAPVLDDDDENDDIIMDDVGEEDDAEPSQLFVKSPPPSPPPKSTRNARTKPAPRATQTMAKGPSRAAAPAKKQSTLKMTPAPQSQTSSRGTGVAVGRRVARQVVDDIEDDDDDAFAPATQGKSRRK